jgi:NAD(P)-dependent dehydrogenase (short-subunit alcohol dehydrogenase family)
MKLSDDSSMKSKRPVVLVTGGVAGIGRAVVLAFARAGYVIGLSDIKSANSESLLKEIKA